MQTVLTKTQSTTPTESKDKWRTPDNERQPILTLVQRAFGDEIWLDPTSDDNKSVKARNHFTQSDNCLTRTWMGNKTAYMNPPYSHPQKFVAKLVEEYERGHVNQAIAFVNAEGLPQKGADFDTCILYWGIRVQEFGEAFSPYGSIFVPYR